jgi:hypothetical protein
MLLERARSERETTATYQSDDGHSRLVFRHRFDKDTEITGGAKLKIWMSAERHSEIDVFVALQKFDVQNQEVGFRYFSTFSEGPVALGWLRASHRALNADLSAELQPVHRHTQRELLRPGEPVPLEVEIWPSGTLFRRGEVLQLVIAGADLYAFETGAPELGHKVDNRGSNSVHAGARYDSYLVIPTITS